MNKEKRTPIFVLVAAILWGTTGTAQSFAPELAHPIAIGAARLAIGGFSLMAVVLLTKRMTFKNWPVKQTILAAVCMACYQPLFFSSVKVTGVAIGTVIAIGSAPILSGAIEWAFAKRMPSKKWWGATLLSIAGCILLFLNDGSIQVDPLGVLLALGAGLSFASYTFVSAELGKKQSSLVVVAVVFSLSAIILSPFLVIYDMSWMIKQDGVLVSLHLGLITTSLAYYLFAKGLLRVPSSTAVTISLAEPLTAAMLGIFLLNESMNIVSWVGLFLLISGIVFLILPTKKIGHTKIKTVNV
ncbi:EamA family transporter [Metabacillus sp. HB246100]|uniref:EamA family transporter n=1 Tax=Bacillus weihaiensis TaxID=1547283 RepID=UPI002352C8B4|nr:EamA family transporter [Bacillus weihaiensis]